MIFNAGTCCGKISMFLRSKLIRVRLAFRRFSSVFARAQVDHTSLPATDPNKSIKKARSIFFFAPRKKATAKFFDTLFLLLQSGRGKESGFFFSRWKRFEKKKSAEAVDDDDDDQSVETIGVYETEEKKFSPSPSTNFFCS
jgi:hypothetical protein